MAMHTSDDRSQSEVPPVGIRDGGPYTSDVTTKVEMAAHRLAVYFTEDTKLPMRFRRSSSSVRPRKIKEDSEVEKRFKADIMLWTQLIATMLAKIDSRLAWRFIGLSPGIEPTVRKVSDCKDFCDFEGYLILRRDIEECGDDELGGLALLSTAFQHEIEKRIQAS